MAVCVPLFNRTLVSVENVIAVEDDIFPGDGTDVAEQVEVYMIRESVCLDDTVNFLGLPGV